MQIQKVTFSLENHPKVSLRNLMRSYQAARKASKSNAQITMSRLNKGLGLAMRKTYDRGYNTTLEHCNCMDSQRTSNIICKHRLALMLVARGAHLDAQEA